MIINLEKNNLIVVLFKEASAKRILLQAVVSSNAKDRLELSESISKEIFEIEEMAWQEVRKQNPQIKSQAQFTFCGHPPSIIVNEI